MIRELTDKEAKHIYNTKRWKKNIREKVLARDGYQCQDCIERLKKAKEDGAVLKGRDAKIRRATHVHHINDLKTHPDQAYDMDNLISLCTECHNLRHGRVMTRFGPVVSKKKKVTTEMW